MAEAPTLDCEVAYARPDRQFVIALTLPAGATAQAAFLQAMKDSLAEQCPEISAAQAVLGIFGKVVPPDWPLRAGDRVEIYRPLTADPRAARRARVTAVRKKNRK